MGRAFAHGRKYADAFDDPTALALLPPDARRVVERALSGQAPKGLRERFIATYLTRQSRVQLARTVAIDRAVREAAAPEVVILGAGLDGRAWRMPELRDAIVFEVDHPDTQRDKRERAAHLTPMAREVRFVPVNFERDSLASELEKAGHDRGQPTTWIWEGVVMYLTPADVDATLAAISQRSAARSRVVILYTRSAWTQKFVGVFVRQLGEPFRSTFEPDAMRALLARHGFDVTRDQSIPEIGASLSAEIGRATRFGQHLRVVIADKR
jgi:methyltransferase (TIGR00027 family)